MFPSRHYIWWVDGLIVPPKENGNGRALILDFGHVIKVLNHFRKVFRKVTTLNVLEVSSYPTSFSEIFKFQYEYKR